MSSHDVSGVRFADEVTTPIYDAVAEDLARAARPSRFFNPGGELPLWAVIVLIVIACAGAGVVLI